MTNTSPTDTFLGIPSSTLFTSTAGDPFFLSGVTGLVDGTLVSEGDGLRDIAASPPFLGGFLLNPGESRTFVMHVIYGLLCNACVALPPPALESAPCGETLTLVDSSLDIRTGTLVNGVIESDPNVPPDIRLFATGPYPLTVTVACEPTGPTEVLIDIKPGSDPNSINPRSKGVIPVAVLSAGSFDASDVDASTAAFGPGGATPKHNGHSQDVNGDGSLDLVLHFATQQTGIQHGDTEACLTAATFGGEALAGCDSIRTVGR